MSVIKVYKCLCDPLRLRILSLLRDGPLCVCHLMEALNCPQVPLSKQLRYMRELGLLVAERQANWMIYRLTSPVHPLLEENLRCLQDLEGESSQYARDRKQRDLLLERLKKGGACPDVVLVRGPVQSACKCRKPGRTPEKRPARARAG